MKRHFDIPAIVRNKAIASGAAHWLESLPDVVAHLEETWQIELGRIFDGGTEAFVAAVTQADGTQAVLKVSLDPGDAILEAKFLRLAGGDGCVALLRDDPDRGAFLLERLGPSMHDLGLPFDQRIEALCAAALRIWRPAPDCGLTTGADKGRWLGNFIAERWDALDRPCTSQAVDHALACARRRTEAHDADRAVLVHGDIHEWNALSTSTGFKLIDPDGMLAEAEADLGILMREDPVELMQGDPRDRAHFLARRCALDATAIWEWGVAERVSTGLLCTQIGLQPVGAQMLAAADRIARDFPNL